VARRGRSRPLIVGLAIGVAATGMFVARHGDPDPVMGAIALGPRITSVVMDEQTGRAFVGISDDAATTGRLDVLDTATGAVLRVDPLAASPMGIVVDERRRHVFVSESTGGTAGVVMVDAGSGKILRTVPVGSYPTAVAVDERAGRLFVATPDSAACPRYDTLSPCGKVAVVDTATGQLLRTFTVRGRVTVAAVDGRANRLIVAGDDGFRGGTVSVLDATSGRPIASVHIRSQLGLGTGHALAVDERAGRAFLLGANYPTYTAGAVYVLDTRGGALIRTLATSTIPTGVAVDSATGRAFVSTLGHIAHAGVSNHVTSIGQGLVSVLDARSGKVVATAGVGIGAFAVAVSGRDGRLLVTNVGDVDSSGSDTTFHGTGSVTVLDEHGARVVRTLPTGVFPIGVLADGRRGRALVVNYGGTVRVRDAWGWLPPWLRRALPFLPRAPKPTRGVASSITVLDTSR